MAETFRTPQNPLIADLTPLAAGLAGATFRGNMNTQFELIKDYVQTVEALAELEQNAFGFGGLTGGELSAGTGLTANIALGSAIVGTYTSWSAEVSPALTAATTNYIFRRQDGTWTANTTGTTPSGDGHGHALLWGTATTDGSGVTAVTNNRRVYQAQSSRLSKSVAGAANVTLTTAELVNPTLEFTGALTGSISVFVKLFDGWKALVYNNTSGAFTLTIAGTTGTGVQVPQGQRIALYSDGTNVYAQESGAGAYGWGVADLIPDGMTVTVPSDYQQAIFDSLTVYGTLTNYGKVRVI